MFLFLTVVQAIIAAMLVGVILMQKSEGGGLGVGGSPSGMMSARGAADLLTRSTTVLAVLFVSLSVALAVLAAAEGKPATIDQTLQRDNGALNAPAQPADAVPLAGDDPLAAAAAGVGEGSDAAATDDAGVPLDQ